MLETALTTAAWVALIAASLLVRRRFSGHLPRPAFWMVLAAAILAVTAGSIVDVSGVLLAIPVVALAAVVILRGGWWLGDTGLFLLLLGGGTAGAYVLAAVIDPDTGSYADQSAVLLVILGALISLTAIGWTLIRARLRGRATTPPPRS